MNSILRKTVFAAIGLFLMPLPLMNDWFLWDPVIMVPKSSESVSSEKGKQSVIIPATTGNRGGQTSYATGPGASTAGK